MLTAFKDCAVDLEKLVFVSRNQLLFGDLQHRAMIYVNGVFDDVCERVGIGPAAARSGTAADGSDSPKMFTKGDVLTADKLNQLADFVSVVADEVNKLRAPATCST